MKLSRTYGNNCTAVWLALAIFSGTIQPVIAAGSNDIVEKPYIQSPTDTNPHTQTAKSADYISVKDFGAKCDGITDDAAAVQKAVNAAPHILFPKGTCLLNSTVTLRAGTALRGEGMKVSIVKQGGTSGASMGTFYANSGASGSKLTGIQIADMTIYGQSDVLGFSEFQHLVSLNGVKDILIEKVEFRGFRGDGLYIGSGNKGGDERHNENVTVRSSVFDGVNNSNRNGISIIDGNGVLIEGNTFRSTTKPKEPGAIDVEPNSLYNVIKDIKIVNNFFKDNGGTNGSISVYLQDLAWTVQPSGFLFSGNEIDGGTSHLDHGIFFIHVGNATASRGHNLQVTNNKVRRVRRGFELGGINTMLMSGNQFEDISVSPLLGFNDGTRKNLNIKILNNSFVRIGNDNTSGGSGLSIFEVDYLDIIGNTFVDCGKANGTFGYAIDFNKGTSSYINIEGNRFENPNGKTTVAIQKEAGHTFTPATNSARNNQLIGVSGNAFQATNPQ